MAIDTQKYSIVGPRGFFERDEVDREIQLYHSREKNILPVFDDEKKQWFILRRKEPAET